MKEAIYILGNKEAAPVGWNGSYADEGTGQSWWLPVTVVSSHVNSSAIDHTEMASDINGLTGCFLALCAKALSMLDNKLDFDSHFVLSYYCCESRERLVKSTSPAFRKKEYLLTIGRHSLLISIGEHPKYKSKSNANIDNFS